MNIVIYCRISRDIAGKGAGVASQEADCRTLAEQNGWNVLKVFTDNDISAYSGKTRPAYDSMLDYVRRGGVDGIVCWHIDRLYRRTRDLEQIVDLVEGTGVRVETVKSGRLDLNSATGRMTARVVASTAQYEVDHQVERQKASHTARAAAGKWRGGWIPVGYRQGAEKGTLEIDETYAAVVRFIIREVLDGRSLMSISKKLNEGDVPPRPFGGRQAKKWTARTVRSAAINPAVAGLSQHHEEIVGRGQWSPIVDETDWAAAREILTDPARRTHAGHEKKWQGTGLYRCGRCGAKMMSAKGKTRRATGDGPADRVYACKHCNRCQRRMEPTDEVVDAVVLGYLSKPENRLTLINRDRGEGVDARAVLDEKNSLVRRKDSLAALFASGTIDEAQLVSGTDEIRRQIEDADRRLKSVRRVSPAVDLVLDGEDLEKRYHALPAEVRGQIIDELVTVTIMPASRGKFDPTKIKIDWK